MNREKFIMWLEGYLDALKLEGVKDDKLESIRKRMDEIQLDKFAKKVYSQNGEDGITLRLLDLLYDNPKGKYYVEFGVENGDECNTRILYENYQWNGLLMDGGYYNTNKNLQLEFITKENIEQLFIKHNVPKHINLLSVDIDMNDWHVLKKILQSGYFADIIIVEYNGHIPPTEAKSVPYEPTQMWDGTNWYGASLLAFNKLLVPEGYVLVCTDPRGVNAFFVREKLLKERDIWIKDVGDVVKLYNSPNFQNRIFGEHPSDDLNRRYINV